MAQEGEPKQSVGPTDLQWWRAEFGKLKLLVPRSFHKWLTLGICGTEEWGQGAVQRKIFP